MGLISALFKKSKIKTISSNQLKDELNRTNGKQFIDVRTKGEYKAGHIRQFKNLPLQNLETSMAKLKKEKPIYVICQSGGRSSRACKILSQAGFEKVYNVRGGMMVWNSKNK